MALFAWNRIFAAIGTQSQINDGAFSDADSQEAC